MKEDFTSGELKLMFQRIEEKLDDLREDIANTNTHFESRLNTLEGKVREHENLLTKAMAIWGVAVTAIGFALNKFL